MSLITKSIKRRLTKTFALRIERPLSLVMFSDDLGTFSHLGDELIGALFLGIRKDDVLLLDHDRKKTARLIANLSLVCKSWHHSVKSICPKLKPHVILKNYRNIRSVAKVVGDTDSDFLTLDGGMLVDFIDLLPCISKGIRALCLTGHIMFRSSDLVTVLKSMTDLTQLCMKRVEFLEDIEIKSSSLRTLFISNFTGSINMTIDCPNLEQCTVRKSCDLDPMNVGLGSSSLTHLSIRSDKLTKATFRSLWEMQTLKVYTKASVDLDAMERCFHKIREQSFIDITCARSSSIKVPLNVPSKNSKVAA